ncbi:hypothetical protein LTR66_011572 [Elasticomyces elasticus]|nr:hypothetical protein LTR66_011572 [Elasticomyces elasticus]
MAYLGPLMLLAMAASTQAQHIIESLSFGHKSPISPDSRAISGWQLSGEKHQPHVLSDRIVLTPPVPGNTRGALWAESSSEYPEWVIDFEFRASGEERGSGNLQVWFAKDGQGNVGLNSVYTVGKFDGLALVIDQYGGRGGGIRGFLNDGTTSYKDHHNVDSLAFGHCDYSYRNLGRPSHLRVTNGATFKVEIDERICFESGNIRLPTGYSFGITAASAAKPDSFEVSKFAVSTTTSHTREEVPKPPVQQQQQDLPQAKGGLHRLASFPGAPEAVADADAATFKSQEAQFADLHNRLQGLTHQIANIFVEFDRLSWTISEKHKEMMGGMPTIPHNMINAMDRRLENVERVVQTIQRDVEGRDYKEHLSNLQQAVEGTRGMLSNTLPDTLSQIVSTSRPKMGLFVFVVIAFQVLLVGAYIVYKRRRASAPKKYL